MDFDGAYFFSKVSSPTELGKMYFYTTYQLGKMYQLVYIFIGKMHNCKKMDKGA